MAFPIFWTYRSHFWTCCSCAKDRNMPICSWKCSACGQKTRSRRSFSKVSQREHCICEAASRIGLQNQGAICENECFMCEGKHGWVYCLHTYKTRRRCFQTFKKAYHEKLPFITVDEKGDTCMNSEVCNTVVKWLDWPTSQAWLANSILGYMDSLRGVPSVGLPCGVPIKSGYWNYFKHLDTFADVFLKMMLCSGFW